MCIFERSGTVTSKCWGVSARNPHFSKSDYLPKPHLYSSPLAPLVQCIGDLGYRAVIIVGGYGGEAGEAGGEAGIGNNIENMKKKYKKYIYR